MLSRQLQLISFRFHCENSSHWTNVNYGYVLLSFLEMHIYRMENIFEFFLNQNSHTQDETEKKNEWYDEFLSCFDCFEYKVVITRNSVEFI